MPLISLPTGTLKYLKGHPDGIVAIVPAALGLGAIGMGVTPLAAICVLAVCGGLYHIRCNRAEAHKLDMAKLKIEQAIARACELKTRYRASIR